MENNVVAQPNGGGLANQVVSLITAQNSDVDNALLLNKMNMIIAKTPKIASMAPEIISQAILKAMIPDATLQDHDDIYFVPYGRTIDVSFSHNYLQKLAYRNGAVKLIETHLIYDQDNVSVTNEGVTFAINPFKKDRGNFAGVMVIVKLGNGETKYGFVSEEHIEKARKSSKSGNNGPWKTWFFEMAKKVAIKNTLKGLDISEEFSNAVRIDNEDTDFSKSSNTEPPKAANDLEKMMKNGSKEVSNAEEYLTEIGVAFDIKGDWIMIDVINSDEGGVATLGEQMKLISKEDKPGMLFGKISELTGEVK